MVLERIRRWPRAAKQFIMLAVDFIFLSTMLWLALCLRLGIWVSFDAPLGWTYLLPPLVSIPIFAQFGLYKSVIRYLDDRAIVKAVVAISLSVVILSGVISLLSAHIFPRGALLIYWLIAVVYIVLSRYSARELLRVGDGKKHQKRAVLIYGAGASGRQLVKAMRVNNEFKPVAFVDDDPSLAGLQISGLMVYSAQDIPRVLARYMVTQILLAMPSVDRARHIEIINTLEPLQIEVRSLPGMMDIVDGEVHVSDIREVEIDALLGRKPVPPQPALLAANITGKAVMVTGAGGSIGAELCRQILKNAPAILILYEQSEFALYSIEQEITQAALRSKLLIDVIPVLGSVLNKERLSAILHKYDVQTVYHAAAYKHVPLVEFNMTEGVINNTFGTLFAAEAAIRAGVKTFVLISTDKAVRPTNVMGASKRMAELVLQAFSAESGMHTCFSMVRFGNVLDSSGSVVPLFRKQLVAGGPLTVTHPDITRYFMTIPEASQLVIQAGAMGMGGEVFLLDMGSPVKIVDLARRMVHLSGLSLKDEGKPDGDIEITYTGLRPGEKLYEELLVGESARGTSHPLIMCADEQRIPLNELRKQLDILYGACLSNDCDKILAILRLCVSGFFYETEVRDHLQILGVPGAVNARRHRV